MVRLGNWRKRRGCKWLGTNSVDTTSMGYGSIFKDGVFV
jgi:hypothetical protein